jgi:prepilin-type processing-associated H-X9-DG protein
VAIILVGFGAFIVAGVLITMIARSRASGDRVRCQDNLRRIGLGYLADEAAKSKAFPAGTVNVAKLPPEQRVSWVVPGLARLGQPDAANAVDVTAAWNIDPNKTTGRTFVSVLACPSIADLRATDGYGPLDYPGLAGVGTDAATKPANAAGAGIFRYNEPTYVTEVKDGLANTLALLETSSPGAWIAGGPPTIRPLDPATLPYIGPGRPFGGNHFGGANAVYADGSVRFITDRVSPRVLELEVGIADSIQNGHSQ